MTPKFLTVSEKETDALPIKDSGIERAVDIPLEEIIMTSVLSSLSFSLLSVIYTIILLKSVCLSAFYILQRPFSKDNGWIITLVDFITSYPEAVALAKN